MRRIVASTILQRDRLRFWAHVDQSAGPDACWPWKLWLTPKGYGTFKLNGRVERAHRVALALDRGWISETEQGLHSCDIKPCCNPKHIRPGTNLENMQDRKARGGYSTMPKGNDHWLRKPGAVHWTKRPNQKKEI